MSNLVDIQSQIDKLQKQASEIRVREFDKTVQEILAKMNAFGITLRDLQPKKAGKLSGKRGPKSSAKGAVKAARSSMGKRTSPRAGTVVPPKFRGPNGETWSGRGLMPRWLSALVAQGRTKEQFAVSV
jgi:DNA-binding protein H-NS